jgi:hypothetical protein
VTACNERPPEGHPFHGSLVACHMTAGHDGPHAWEYKPSLARQGLDRLLATFAHRELDWLASDATGVAFNLASQGISALHGRVAPAPGIDSSWVVVEFVGGDQFAIWKATGDVYRIGPDGAVDDDPILPAPRPPRDEGPRYWGD